VLVLAVVEKEGILFLAVLVALSVMSQRFRKAKSWPIKPKGG
jgi:hypothetical protein